MNFNELLSTVTWPEVETQLLEEYSDCDESIEGYSDVFYTLQQIPAAESNMRIVIYETFHEGFDSEPYITVSGRDGTLNKELSDFKHLNVPVDSKYANSETDYSIAMVSWDEWLGMDIDPKTNEEFTSAEVAAYCLWEMTFYGFDEVQIQEQKDELRERIDEWESLTEEEKEERSYTFEEVKEQLKNRLK